MNPQVEGVLLDTDVFSHLLNENDRRADFYRLHVQDKILSVSFGRQHFENRSIAAWDRHPAVRLIAADIFGCILWGCYGTPATAR